MSFAALVFGDWPYGGAGSCLDEWITEGFRHGTEPTGSGWGEYEDGEQAKGDTVVSVYVEGIPAEHGGII